MKSPEGFTLVLLSLIVPVVCPACNRAEYQIGDDCCPMCPPGTRVNKHCTDLRSTSCFLCEQFTYMDEPTGRTQCLLCRTCASGSRLKVKTACSSQANAVCEAQEGHFCAEEDGGSCRTAQRHKSCGPGQFIQTPGSSSADTVCEECPEETFSSDGTNCTAWTRCSDAQVEVRAGSRRQDVLCGHASRSHVGVYVSLTGVALMTVLVLCVARLKVFQPEARFPA